MRSQQKYWKLTIITLLLFSLAGCGQMGPLYLPDADAQSHAHSHVQQHIE